MFTLKLNQSSSFSHENLSRTSRCERAFVVVTRQQLLLCTVWRYDEALTPPSERNLTSPAAARRCSLMMMMHFAAQTGSSFLSIFNRKCSFAVMSVFLWHKRHHVTCFSQSLLLLLQERNESGGKLREKIPTPMLRSIVKLRHGKLQETREKVRMSSSSNVTDLPFHHVVNMRTFCVFHPCLSRAEAPEHV